MDSRERFLATMNFEKVSPPLYEMGYWVWTIKRWYEEGLPQIGGLPRIDSLVGGDIGASSLIDDVWFIYSSYEEPVPSDIERVVNFDRRIRSIPGNWWIFPEYETKIIQEEKDSLIVLDRWGARQRIRKRQDCKVQYLDWPVRNREDWERFKEERLNPETPGRFPPGFDTILQDLEERDYPVTIGPSGPMAPGFFGPLRYLLGEERLFTIYYDNPSLVADMISYLCDFWIQMWDPILARIRPDCASMWEDMCYKTGSLISPDFFREFMLPAYKKITSFLKGHGVNHVILDTDGNCWSLIPLFIEGGITGLQPMEVAAGMDIVEVRKSFPRLQILGGIDKRTLAKGKAAIDEELDKKVAHMINKGGYVPFVDHSIPPDVAFSDFQYYRKRIEQLARR